jgi:glucose-6-phosphate-specific signal transduction histidine kinase
MIDMIAAAKQMSTSTKLLLTVFLVVVVAVVFCLIYLPKDKVLLILHFLLSLYGSLMLSHIKILSKKFPNDKYITIAKVSSSVQNFGWYASLVICISLFLDSVFKDDNNTEEESPTSSA